MQSNSKLAMKMSSANPPGKKKVMIKTTKSKFGKGTKSKTRKGDLDFTTKKGNKDFDIDGKRVIKMKRPFEGNSY
tara:strand:+ start:1806 stop:2030 length:225 start_codon:yes stop_codon:yes gene_type:complete